MKKALLWIALAFVAVVVIGLGWVLVRLPGIIQRTVETQGSVALNAKTLLDGVGLSPLQGDVSMTGFTIGSPQGYTADHMLALGAVDIDTNLGQLRKSPMRIDSIGISNPTLILEMKGREFNIKKFVDGLPPSDPNAELPALIIDRLTLTGAKVVLRPDVSAIASIPGLSQIAAQIKPEYVLTIPPVQVNQIGTGPGAQNGAAVKDVVTQMIMALSTAALESPDLPPELAMLLSGDLSAIKDRIAGILSEEARKQIDAARAKVESRLGAENVQMIESAIKDPNAAIRQVKETAEGSVRDAINDAVKDPSTITNDPQKSATDIMGNLLKPKPKPQTPAPAPTH